MTLTTGQILTHYEILVPLGAGGMGEVYRARDTRLDRDVAIKVLPEELADDDERLRRFEREAKTLASLNHTNLAHVYGIDQVEDTCFIAMELVPGEDLATKLARGPLPVDEAVDVCRQVAKGLEAAHEAGVVHRDLKPANVRVTPEGVVKLLDFGLAKPIHPRATKEGTTTAQSDSFLVTEEGMVLGTPTYMSPEQARGKPVDRRVDVWAFGCVLYECLTGERAFGGDTLTDVLATVLHEEPDWSRLPAETPPHVRTLLARCLEKDARRRQRDMGDVWLELTRADEPVAAAPQGGAGKRPVIAAAILAVAAGTWLGFSLHGTPRVEWPRTTYSSVPVAHDLQWHSGNTFATFAVSPNGESVVYISKVDRGAAGTVYVLACWLRSEPETTVLWEAPTGTGLISPFFSQDGDWVYFDATTDGSRYGLRRVSASRPGEPEAMCALPAAMLGVDWGPGGTLFFGTLAGGIFRWKEGGAPEPVTTPEHGVEWLHRSPEVLSDGESMLYSVDFEGLRNEVRRRVLTSGQEQVLIPGARWAHTLGPDLLLYVTGESLWADGFDPSTGRLAGTAVQLQPRIRKVVPNEVDVSSDGTLVYCAPVAQPKRSIRWVHRDGTVEETGLPGRENYAHVSFSPDGTHAVLGFGEGLYGGAVRVWDFARSRLDPPLVSELAAHPTWTPDGEQIVWYSNDGGVLERSSAAGGGVPERGGIFEAAPLQICADGRVLFASMSKDGGTSFDLFLAPFEAEGRTDREPLVTDAGPQVYGVFSSDEKKLAYESVDDLGMPRLFVTRVPVDGPGELATPYGGAYPRWSRDGSELFYAYRVNLLRITVTDRGDHFEFSEPDLIYTGVSQTNGRHCPFDASPDGQRFLVLEDDAPVEQPRLFLVTNLIEEVRASMAKRN